MKLTREEIIVDIKRVANSLSLNELSRNDYSRHGKYSVSTVRNKFGTWGKAVQEADLLSKKQGQFTHTKIPDEKLLLEIRRLADKLGKPPTDNEMNAEGKFSSRPYIKRWGTFTRARDIALSGNIIKTIDKPSVSPNATSSQKVKSSPSYPPLKGTAYGDFLNFRGLQHAPINEQGVVFLFGMVCSELGYVVEAVKPGFPDCEAKRKIAGRKGQWERVKIEFEFQSRNFLDHGHDSNKCDVIVCWEHNWPGCPIEVLELKETIKKLPSKQEAI